MKSTARFLVTASLALPAVLVAQQTPATEAPVPVYQSSAPQAGPAAPRQENQQLYGPAGATIIAPDLARSVVEKFREIYGKENASRILIYVNRELVDTQTGLRLTGRTEKYDHTQGEVKSDVEAPAAGNPQTQVNVAVGGGPAGSGVTAPVGKGTTTNESNKTAGENTYTNKDATAATLADRQTVREVERLFGRPFRAAGARLADQGVAVAMMADKPSGYLTGASDQAAKDRAALSKVADIVVEVLVTSRNLSIPSISGEASSISVPDIQTTAIRLSDAGIIGQASASDVLGKDRYAGKVARQFDVRDITEATALALMEDMLSNTSAPAAAAK